MLITPRTEVTPALAAEPAGVYEVAPTAAATPSRTRRRLDEVAELLDDRDRRMARVVRLLVAVRDNTEDVAQVCGGMSLHVWLQHTARCTHGEARDLLAAAEVLADLPATLAGLADGWLSWSQAQAICRAARTVRVRLLAELDQLVAEAMIAHRDWEPDALVADVWDWTDRNQPTRLERAEAAAERDRFLTLSPRLFGGGSLYGEFDTVGFATLAEALHAPLGPPVAVPDDLDDPEAVETAFDTLDEQRRALTRSHGTALADRLVALCERDLAGTTDGEVERAPRPLLLATVGLHSLLDTEQTPGWLLTTLAGGRMKASSATLRRLVDERGADLRTIVLDDCGQVVGVGRRTSVPPRWLREAIWARDIAVRDPDGVCPIRRADLDHVTPWPAGPTDVDNLAPLGRRWHNRKTSKHWTVARARDGTTTWTHRRHGWTIRLAPPRRGLDDVPDPGPPRPPAPRLPLDLPEPAPT